MMIETCWKEMNIDNDFLRPNVPSADKRFVFYLFLRATSRLSALVAPKNKEPRFHQKAGFLFAETITKFI